MDHEGSCHVHHRLDGSFSTTILVLGPNAGESLLLKFRVTVITKFVGREDSIIAVISFDFRTGKLIEPLFKSRLRADRFICAQRDLILNPNGAGGGVIEYRTPVETIMFCFATIARV